MMGSVPGSGDRDSHLAAVMPGEWVLRKPARMALQSTFGHDFLPWLNYADRWLGGGSRGIAASQTGPGSGFRQSPFGLELPIGQGGLEIGMPRLPHYQFGGLVNWFESTAKTIAGDVTAFARGIAALVSPSVETVLAAAPDVEAAFDDFWKLVVAPVLGLIDHGEAQPIITAMADEVKSSFDYALAGAGQTAGAADAAAAAAAVKAAGQNSSGVPR